MSDMMQTIIPKSDQANYDDFIGGVAKTIKVTKVTLVTGEQPIAIHYEGDNGKPYKPCKSMRRVLIHCWGGDGKEYVGRSMTLYGDPEVKFGGVAVGGIRIAALSHIKESMTIALTTTRAHRKPYSVQPLTVSSTPSADDFIADFATVPTLDGLKHKFTEATKLFKDSKDFARIHEAKEKRKAELTPMKE